MIAIRLGSPPGVEGRQVYRIAGRRIVADRPLAALAGFEERASADGRRRPLRHPAPPPRSSARATFSIGRGPGELECRSGPDGYVIEVAEAGGFEVDLDAAITARPAADDAAALGLLAEAIAGPGLLLALALRGTYCLHAAAVASGASAIAFLGESGAGKSTLAGFFRCGACPLERLADDLLPVEIGRAGPSVLARFPQSKLAPGEQRSAGKERLALAAIYLLAAPAERAAVEIETLGPRAAMLALSRHTAGAVLFDGRLLTRHLDFCGRVSGRVPVRLLRYARVAEFLPMVTRAIRSDLADRVPAGGRRPAVAMRQDGV